MQLAPADLDRHLAKPLAPLYDFYSFQVIAKYAPFENKLFEVVSLVEWKDEPLEETRLSVYQNTVRLS